jgi:hypothetical protein
LSRAMPYLRALRRSVGHERRLLRCESPTVRAWYGCSTLWTKPSVGPLP